MLNIVCVKDGNKYSSKYVNILLDRIARNVDESIKFKFICFTNDATGIDPDIEIRELPSELSGRGWWNKLYLFKDGLFADGDRVIYFDLKNLPVSSLDEVMAYDGDFAMLRDFYRIDGAASGLMSWKVNTLGFIWNDYVEANYPDIDGGDQVWIERYKGKFEFWQDLIPSAFVSYKANNCAIGIPKGAKIVFFHGHPYPEEIKEGWVPELWREGAGSSLEWMMQCNTDRQVIIDNIKYALSLDKPIVTSQSEPHAGHAVIVGGGPSINGCVEDLKMRHHYGQHVVALNNSWEWLEKRGIKPLYHVILDAREENVNFITNSETTHKIYATQCHKSVVDKADTLWNALIVDIVPEFDKVQTKYGFMHWIGAGTTVGVRSIFLMYALGYREFHLYGFDSCYVGNDGHAYEQTLNVGERILDVEVFGRKFRAAPWMVTQMHDMLEAMEYLTGSGCVFTVHGDGLFQFAAMHGLNSVQVETTEYPDIVKIDGMYWPENDRICYPSMRTTVDDIDVYLKETKNRRVAVQAGGNVGVFPKRLSKSFDRVYTFEPEEKNFRCMELNCTEPNIIYHKAALGEKEGFVSIKNVDDNCGASFVDGDGDIPVKTIDGMSLDQCDLIQLDIEGYEMNALKGAENTIKKFHPVIVIEENGLSKRYGVENGDVAEWLKQFGYEAANSVHRDLIFKHKAGE